MPPLSPLALAVFLATVAAVAAAFVASVGWWARPAVESAAASRRWRIAALAVLALALALPAALAQAGLLARLEPPPAPAVLLLGGLTLGTVTLAFSPLGTRLALGLGFAGLIGYQAFRVPVEWFLHRAFLEGAVPVQMTFAGLNFDVLSGAGALALGVVARRRALPRALVLAWNLAGLALLANIVAIAVLSLPLPFRAFPDPPANLLPLHLPTVWLPSFLVQAALFGHLLVFRKLRRERHA